MHEAAVAHAILKRALQAVYPATKPEDGTDRYDHATSGAATVIENQPVLNVTRILIDIGEFRNVDPESLEFAFSALRKDFASTHNTELEIRQVKALAICSIAGHEYRPTADQYFACTVCGGGIKTLVSGEELNIVSIETEKPMVAAG